MASVKTSISLPEDLFNELEELSGEYDLPRSRIVGKALREFIDRRENRQMLDRLNEVYDEGMTHQEQDVLEGMKGKQSTMDSYD